MTAVWVVEDGTGLSTATAYIETAVVDQYNDDHEAVAAWDGLATPELKQKHVRLASWAADLEFEAAIRGERLVIDQGLAWPRNSFTDAAGFYIMAGTIPNTRGARWKDAVCELSIASANGDTFFASFSPEIETHSYSDGQKSESIGYRGASRAQSSRVYPRVRRMIWDLITPGRMVVLG